ncbi:alpha/beta hydrolase [Paenibacillus sp. Marseille-Q4541]|uniref:alpha/beta hydrolase n=1 Tax=Paenibacillus sp. Marseille-Q4541 TaxID=2831522 RepID=UPI001BA7DC2A|nr:alpha/beta hydrolase [Paenibacillus sp. Marseille-Q4541]
MYQFAFVFLLSFFLLMEGLITFAFRQMIRMKVRSEDYLFTMLEKAGVYHRSAYYELSKEAVWIRSQDGLKLHGVTIEPHPSSHRWVIIVHGYTASHSISTQYIQMFSELGFNLLLIDQRRHGKSEGNYTTFGFKEKYDVEAWIEFINKRAGQDCIIGLHGQSLGGGTVLEYLSIAKPCVKFVIADCPYSDLTELMKYQIRRVKLQAISWFYPLVKRRVLKRAGFRIEQVSPLRAVEESELPVMFIHGTEDRFVPTHMSEDLFSRKIGFKRLLLVEGAVHANAYMANPTLYRTEVIQFVEEIMHLEEENAHALDQTDQQLTPEHPNPFPAHPTETMNSLNILQA